MGSCLGRKLTSRTLSSGILFVWDCVLVGNGREEICRVGHRLSGIFSWWENVVEGFCRSWETVDWAFYEWESV